MGLFEPATRVRRASSVEREGTVALRVNLDPREEGSASAVASGGVGLAARGQRQARIDNDVTRRHVASGLVLPPCSCAFR